MGLDASPRLGTRSFLEIHDDQPDWIGFLLWLGWWVRSHAQPDFRLNVVALLPARNCCCAIATLGVCLAAARRELTTLNFREFMDLPDSTHLSLRERNRIVAGEVGPPDRCGDLPGRWVRVEAKVRLFENLRTWIFEDNFEDHEISTDPRKALVPKRQAALKRVDQFYRIVDPNSRQGWCLSNRRDAMIVASKAQWHRDIEGMVGQVANGDGGPLVVPLKDLVVATEEEQGFPGKVLVVSPAASTPRASSVPVAILDGPDAIRSADDINADAVLMLVERSECSEAVVGEIASMATVREDDVVPNYLPDSLPSGVGVSVFGWRKG